MESQNEFFNKNIVITGASSGIGLSTAFYFLNSNANVVLACQDVKTMEKICKENKFLNAIILKADLEKQSQVEYFLSFITKLFPTIDVLINCAGIKLDSDIEKTYQQDFDYIMNLNLRSIFFILKELRPYFNKEASVINLSCLYGTRPMAGVISYAMSKAGLETLTKYAAAEMASLNIRINAISACPVDTNSLRYVKVSKDEIKYFKKKMESNIPLGRIARADDIVKVIVFLASKRSSRITGQIIKVDGGRSLTSSGYVHFKGTNNMNVKFEPDEVKIQNLLDNYRDKKILDKPITNKEELKKFVNENILKSNFSTRERYKDQNVGLIYYSVKESNSKLTDKYLKGSLPNMLLNYNIKGMSYNPQMKNYNNFPKVDKRQLYYSQINKSQFEEDNNNFKFQNYNNDIIDNKIEENPNENSNDNKEIENENKINENGEDILVREEIFEEVKENKEKEDNKNNENNVNNDNQENFEIIENNENENANNISNNKEIEKVKSEHEEIEIEEQQDDKDN